MIRNIVQAPDKRLLQPSIPVRVNADGSFPEGVKQVIADLIDTRYRGRGAALAAVQIGEHLNIVVTDPNLFYGYTVLANPEITDRGKQIVAGEEGCMSIDMGRLRFKVKRHQVVTVKFLDRNGVERVVVAKGLPARLIQHECDHLHGKLIA